MKGTDKAVVFTECSFDSISLLNHFDLGSSCHDTRMHFSPNKSSSV